MKLTTKGKGKINKKRLIANTEQEGLCCIAQVLPTVDSI